MGAVRVFFKSRVFNVLLALLLFETLWDCMDIVLWSQDPAGLFRRLSILSFVVLARIGELAFTYVLRKRHQR